MSACHVSVAAYHGRQYRGSGRPSCRTVPLERAEELVSGGKPEAALSATIHPKKNCSCTTLPKLGLVQANRYNEAKT